MNRLDKTFSTARQSNRKLLCPFLTAGYPSLDATPALLLAAQAGMNNTGIIELGIPFSDPIADGPVIQESYTHALAHGATVAKALAALAAARKQGLTVPVMVMVTYSIVFKRGTKEFAAACRDAGADGLILPDIPLEEAPAIADAVHQTGMRTTFLIAPTTPPDRRAHIASLCDGFIYYLSVSGITGERRAVPSDIAPNIAALRQVTKTPICVGFGISTPAQVREVTALADGAIVGSALVRRVTSAVGATPEQQAAVVQQFVAELSTGLAN